jgi:hypothetical protein
MGIEKKEIEVAKELADVGTLLVEIVKVIKKKEEMGGLVDDLVEAINGIDQLDDEFKANRGVAVTTLTYKLGEVINVLLPEA